MATIRNRVSIYSHLLSNCYNSAEPPQKVPTAWDKCPTAWEKHAEAPYIYVEAPQK